MPNLFSPLPFTSDKKNLLFWVYMPFNDVSADLSSCWRGPSFWSPTMGKQGGIAILVNENFQGEVLSWRKDVDGRIISLLIKFDNFKINLLSV